MAGEPEVVDREIDGNRVMLACRSGMSLSASNSRIVMKVALTAMQKPVRNPLFLARPMRMVRSATSGCQLAGGANT